MIEVPLFTPEAELETALDRKRLVVSLWQRGLEKPDCVAYHSTSIETIEYMIEHGSIPGFTDLVNYSEHPYLPKIGDVYCLPRISTFPFDLVPELMEEDHIPSSWGEFAFRESLTDDGPAKEHAFAGFLGLDIAQYGIYCANLFTDYERSSRDRQISYDILHNQLGISDAALYFATRYASKRKGVVIGIKREALDNYPATVGDMGNDFRLSTGLVGLHPKFLSGVYPVGKEEKQYFKQWRKDVNKKGTF